MSVFFATPELKYVEHEIDYLGLEADLSAFQLQSYEKRGRANTIPDGMLVTFPVEDLNDNSQKRKDCNEPTARRSRSQSDSNVATVPDSIPGLLRPPENEIGGNLAEFFDTEGCHAHQQSTNRHPGIPIPVTTSAP